MHDFHVHGHVWVDGGVPGTHPLMPAQVGRGLFSAIMVKTAAEEAEMDRDYLVVFHDLDGDWLMGVPAGSGGGGGHASH